MQEINDDSNKMTKCFFEHLKTLYLNEYPIYSRKLSVSHILILYSHSNFILGCTKSNERFYLVL